MASCRNGSQLFPSFRQCSATNEPPPLIDDTIPPPLPAARLQSGVAAARYTCENYEDDGETSGDEDVMASTFVHVLPEEDDGWESGEDLTACEWGVERGGRNGLNSTWVDIHDLIQFAAKPSKQACCLCG